MKHPPNLPQACLPADRGGILGRKRLLSYLKHPLEGIIGVCY